MISVTVGIQCPINGVFVHPFSVFMKKLSAIILCILSVLVLFKFFFLMSCSSTFPLLSEPSSLLFLSPFSSLRVGRSDLLAPSPPLSPPPPSLPESFSLAFSRLHVIPRLIPEIPALLSLQTSGFRKETRQQKTNKEQGGEKIRRKTPTDSLF